MGAFTEGMRLGQGAVQAYIDNQRQAVIDDRAAKEFGWKEEAQNRLAAQNKREDGLRDQLTNSYGRDTQTVTPMGADGQPAAPQQVPIGYLAPDQQGPAAPMGLRAGAMSDADRTGLYARIAENKGDFTGAMSARESGRKLQVRDTLDTTAKMSDDDVLNAVAKTNLSSFGVIYTGKKGKDGYTMMTVDQSGHPTGTQTLTMAQMRGLVGAQALNSAGFGAEAQEYGNQYSKDITNHLFQLNQQAGQMATIANDAQGKSDTNKYHMGKLDVDRQGLAVQASHYKNMEALGRLGATTYREGEDGKTYALTPTMTKGGLQMTTTEVNNGGIRFKQPVDPIKMDANGNYNDSQGPVGRFDKDYGMVPVGVVDPRQDLSLMKNLKGAGVALSVERIPNSRTPVWAYTAPDGTKWSTPQEALKVATAPTPQEIAGQKEAARVRGATQAAGLRRQGDYERDLGTGTYDLGAGM